MTLTLRALRLRGFGRFGDVRVRLVPGLNVLVRPNEWGKSTLVLGIEAALFGLYSRRASGRAAGSGAKSRERLRNRLAPSPFDAVLVFELDGTLYQLYRDFESFRVVLRRRDGTSPLPDALDPPSPLRARRAGEGWTQLFNGLHNPGGEKTSAPFGQLLEQLLGIRTGSLFEQLFCVSQRLPETGRLDGEVQALLSCVGVTGPQAARQRLASRVRSLTSWCQGDNLAQLAARHEDFLRCAAELAELQTKADRLRHEEVELRERLRQLPDWSPWLPSPSARAAQMREQAGRLVACWDEMQQLQRQIEETEQLLRRRFDVLEALDGPAREQLKHYDAAQSALRLARDRAASQRDEMRRRLREMEAGQAAFAQEWADVLECQRRWELASPAEVAERLRARVEQVRRYRELASTQQALGRKLSAARARRRREAWGAAGGILAVTAVATLQVTAARLAAVAPGLPQLARPAVMGPIALAGAAGAAACLWLAHRGLVPLRAMTVEFRSVRAEAERLQRDLAADGLPDDEGRLAAMAERAAACGRSWERLLAEAEDSRRRGVTPQALKELEQKATASQEALDAFLSMTARVRERFGESGIGAAWAEWSAAKARLARLYEARDRLAQRQFDTVHEALREWLPTAARAADLPMAVQDVSSAASLVRWLKAAPSDFWERVERSASQWSDIREHLAHIEMEQKIAADRAQSLRQEIERLRREVAPFDEKTAPDLVARQLVDHRQLRQEVAAGLEEEAYFRHTGASPEGTGMVNVAQAEVEIAEREKRQARVEREIEALTLALRWLDEATAELRAALRERLEREASEFFSMFTGIPGRRVVLDEAFDLKVAEPGGERVLPSALSEGAQVQLYLAIRMAIAATLSHRMRLPFILDDPFPNCDAGHLRCIRLALQKLAEQQQVLVLSHREELAGWGTAVSVDER